MTDMTWREFKECAEANGIVADTAIDAIDVYSPQRNERLTVSVDEFGALIQTQDITRDIRNYADGRDIYCPGCRATFPDPRPTLMDKFRGMRRKGQSSQLTKHEIAMAYLVGVLSGAALSVLILCLG